MDNQQDLLFWKCFWNCLGIELKIKKRSLKIVHCYLKKLKNIQTNSTSTDAITTPTAPIF